MPPTLVQYLQGDQDPGKRLLDGTGYDELVQLLFGAQTGIVAGSAASNAPMMQAAYNLVSGAGFVSLPNGLVGRSIYIYANSAITVVASTSNPNNGGLPDNIIPGGPTATQPAATLGWYVYLVTGVWLQLSFVTGFTASDPADPSDPPTDPPSC
jgi:hypothetical protein